MNPGKWRKTGRLVEGTWEKRRQIHGERTTGKIKEDLVQKDNRMKKRAKTGKPSKQKYFRGWSS